jgi:hypothetical protein
MKNSSRIRWLWLSAALAAGAGTLLSGCGPNRANVKLRRENQALQDRIATLETQRNADLARIQGLQEQRPTVPVLPQEQLAQLYTVHGIKLGPLTGGSGLDEGKPGDQGLKIYFTPVDQDGDPLKATGRVTVEAIDTARAHHMRVGRWEFSPQQMKQAWRSLLSLQAFVLVCPWQETPEHPDLTIHVSFHDELTGRLYSEAREVTVILPPLPATRPATQP